MLKDPRQRDVSYRNDDLVIAGEGGKSRDAHRDDGDAGKRPNYSFETAYRVDARESECDLPLSDGEKVNTPERMLGCLTADRGTIEAFTLGSMLETDARRAEVDATMQVTGLHPSSSYFRDRPGSYESAVKECGVEEKIDARTRELLARRLSQRKKWAEEDQKAEAAAERKMAYYRPVSGDMER